VGEPDKVFGDGVEDIAVQHEITPGRPLVNVIFDDGEIFEIEREKLG
jgi:hypothetical protein